VVLELVLWARQQIVLWTLELLYCCREKEESGCPWALCVSRTPLGWQLTGLATMI
jgi:hypothetical protein